MKRRKRVAALAVEATRRAWPMVARRRHLLAGHRLGGYGIDAIRLRAFRGGRAEQRDAELSCRDVFRASPHPIDCIGPALVDEASRSHVGAWKA